MVVRVLIFFVALPSPRDRGAIGRVKELSGVRARATTTNGCGQPTILTGSASEGRMNPTGWGMRGGRI